MNPFLYVDPTDNTAVNQVIGSGDGSTTTFTLGRALGGFYEPISYALTASALTEVNYGAADGGLNYLPNNLLPNSATSGGGFSPTNMTATTGQTDPLGQSNATLYLETTTVAQHDASLPAVTIPTGAIFIFSTYIKPAGATQYCTIFCGDGHGDNFSVGFDIVNGLVGPAAVYSAAKFSGGTITPAGGGWFRLSVGGCWTSGYTGVTAVVYDNNNSGLSNAPSYAGVVTNGFSLAYPQIEVTTNPPSPRAFMPTSGGAYYGSPLVMENGAPASLSSYSFTAPNTITFTAAPAAGTIISWSGAYAFQCRFLDDSLDFENFMSGVWSSKSIKFRSIR